MNLGLTITSLFKDKGKHIQFIRSLFFTFFSLLIQRLTQFTLPCERVKSVSLIDSLSLWLLPRTKNSSERSKLTDRALPSLFKNKEKGARGEGARGSFREYRQREENDFSSINPFCKGRGFHSFTRQRFRST